MKRTFRVIDFEGGKRTEMLHTVDSAAKTPFGFIQLFYRQWPTAVKAAFEAQVDADGNGHIYTRDGMKAASFLLKKGR